MLRAVDGIAILHLVDAGWEFRAMALDAATWRAWRGLLLFAVWIYEHADPASVTIALRQGAAVSPLRQSS
jgi:hypothetical protein